MKTRDDPMVVSIEELRREALEFSIAKAYHERWCGKPPSCRESNPTSGKCAGMIDRASLAAILVEVELLAPRAPLPTSPASSSPGVQVGTDARAANNRHRVDCPRCYPRRNVQ